MLFNAHRARGPAHDKGRIIAVEGYMDVVALHEGGFAEAVAPLGTALTEDQVKLLWRMSPEPILCFDGDSAGRKAAFRAIDVVLPHLKPGTSVAFAFLPDGLDPDDLIRQQGPAAMETVLARTRPLSTVLFEREWASGDWSTPERRAGLELQLRNADPEDRRCRRARALRAGRPPPPRRGVGPAAARPARSRRRPVRIGYASGSPAANGSPRRLRRPHRRPPDMMPRADDPWREPGRAAAAGCPDGRGAFGPPPSAQRTASLLQSGMVSAQVATLPDARGAADARHSLNHPWLIDEHAEKHRRP